MSEEPVTREPFSNAEFCRFVTEAQEQRARADAAEAQVARLQSALTAALDDLEARDELSALDGLRAALVPGEPSAEPGTEE